MCKTFFICVAEETGLPSPGWRLLNHRPCKDVPSQGPVRCLLDKVSVTTILLQAGSINKQKGVFSLPSLIWSSLFFFNLTTATTWYHHVGNRTSEIMRCKVYLEKSNGRVEVQLRAARVLAGCHSLGGESVKFCLWDLLFLCKRDSGVWR